MRRFGLIVALFVFFALVSSACGRSTIGAPTAAGGGGDGGSGGGACVPTAESCNGGDDDCDGSIDEGCACDIGDVVPCGVGACAGTQSCIDGAWGDCVGQALPSSEVCNGLDDDCNGAIDDGCICAEGSIQGCGSDVGECQQGQQFCQGGAWGPCLNAIGPGPESCDLLDNDCDGATDEDCPCSIGRQMTCGSDVGACEQGVQTCEGGQWGPCNGSIGPSMETCNGIDDDCNGQVDEGCECRGGEVATCGTGTGACEPGTMTCMGGFWGPCSGAIGPTNEECNGIDDDCDGQTDEGFGLGQSCDGPDSDLCADDIMTCAGCSTGQDTLEECNGVDDDCNGVIDNGCEGQPCAADVVVTDISPSSGGCFIDAPVVGDAGTIGFPCSGGAATLPLGDIVFTGTVAGGIVDLTATTQYPWFGCTVQSTQHITGSLGSGTLPYSYSEVIIAGGGCGNPCTATGELIVE
jgi:hypothetical protein